MGLRSFLAAPIRGTLSPRQRGALQTSREGQRRHRFQGRPGRLLHLAAGVALGPLALVAVLRLELGIGVQDMTRDVAAIAHIHPLFGALSSLGILLWSSAAAIWFFSASVHRAVGSFASVRFCVVSGTLSAYFALDDLFQFHEYLAPTYFGLPEAAVYLLLAMAVACYLWAFRSQLLRTDAILLLLSLCFLGGSVSIDAVLEQWLWRLEDWTYLIEDGLKWLGILGWLGFCVARCRSGLTGLLRQCPEDAMRLPG